MPRHTPSVEASIHAGTVTRTQLEDLGEVLRSNAARSLLQQLALFDEQLQPFVDENDAPLDGVAAHLSTSSRCARKLEMLAPLRFLDLACLPLVENSVDTAEPYSVHGFIASRLHRYALWACPFTTIMM